MQTRQGLIPLLALAAAALAPRAANAAVFNIACGTGGSTDALQAQVSSLTTPGNTINVTGTCVGDLDTSRTERLTINGLNLTGSLTIVFANTPRFDGLTLNGPLTLSNARGGFLTNSNIRGDVVIVRGSQVTFNTITMSPFTDSTGTHDPSFNCTGLSECTLNLATLTGGGSSTTSVGALAASASRLNFNSGTISGFAIGVQAWNNATAFVSTTCDPIIIRANKTSGIAAYDSAMVKVTGTSAADATSLGCAAPVTVDISSNGKYGVLADGGGNAYVQLARISGHTTDGVRVQHGSVVRVRSSTIDAATATGRSARVKAQAHLYFDEQEAGPTARSTLAGPVCTTGSSTVDTDNSATVVTVRTSCPGA